MFVFISNLKTSSVVYAAIWFMHVCKIWDNDLTEYQLWYKFTELSKAFRHSLTANRNKTLQRIFSYNSGCKRKLWATFLPRVHLWKKQTPGSRLKTLVSLSFKLEELASIVLNIEWVQFLLQNCEILHSVLGLYDKTEPHSTVSPQVCCINGIKGCFTRTQICWHDFVK